MPPPSSESLLPPPRLSIASSSWSRRDCVFALLTTKSCMLEQAYLEVHLSIPSKATTSTAPSIPVHPVVFATPGKRVWQGSLCCGLCLTPFQRRSCHRGRVGACARSASNAWSCRNHSSCTHQSHTCWRVDPLNSGHELFRGANSNVASFGCHLLSAASFTEVSHWGELGINRSGWNTIWINAWIYGHLFSFSYLPPNQRLLRSFTAFSASSSLLNLT